MSAGDVGLVLVVDDDPTVRLIARATLEKVGFVVKEAADGETASAACRSHRPDIVLLDVNLPGRSGMEVCAELRRQGDRTPVLMMTGEGDDASIRQAYDVGATDFIGKPLNWTILSHRLRYLLRASRSAHELSLLAAAVEQSAEGILITSAQGTILYANPAFERITGHSAQEVVGGTSADLRSTEGSAELFARQKETVALGRPWRGEYVARRKDGSRYNQDCTISPVAVSSDRDPYSVVVIRDVTRERELERQLLEAQRLEALGTLAGGIAHDFNNLLQPIIGFAELALTVLPAGGPVPGYMGRILAAATRASELVGQILVFSRQGGMAKKPLSLGPLAQEVLALACASSPEPIDGRLTVDRLSDVILGDPSQIQQVLLNLCINAVHAMRGRRARILDVRVEPLEIDGAALPHPALCAGPHVRLSVSDTGHGMAPEILQRIFEPFFTTKEPGQGTGIGLAAVHGIVRRHGGAVTVSSRLDEGTTFQVCFPRHLGPLPQEEGEKREAASVETGRVLVVDDDEAVSDVAQRTLRESGFSVDTAQGAAEALQAFRADPSAYDVVVTDVAMPGMSGLELARELLALRPGLPVILCTGYSEAITTETAAQMGIHDVLLKPWTGLQLLAALRRALGSQPMQV